MAIIHLSRLDHNLQEGMNKLSTQIVTLNAVL